MKEFFSIAAFYFFLVAVALIWKFVLPVVACITLAVIAVRIIELSLGRHLEVRWR